MRRGLIPISHLGECVQGQQKSRVVKASVWAAEAPITTLPCSLLAAVPVQAAGSTKNAQIRRVSTPAIKSCRNTSARAVTIKWTKNSLATGYDVWYSDGRTSKSIRIKNKATLSQTVKGLTKGKTYTFKVRGIYITSSGTIFKSAWKPAKVKIVK